MPVVRKVTTKSIECRPTLVSFQNGNILPDQGDQIGGNLYESEDKKLWIGVTTSNMAYTGKIDDNKDFNHFLLLHNRETEEIELIQINRSLVCPRVSKYDEVNKSVSLHDETSISILNKEFGSKRRKRLTEQRERLIMNIDAVKDQLEDTVAAWRLLPKKVINRSDVHHIDTSEPPPLVQLPNVSNQQGHEMQITNLTTPNTTQHIQTNTVLQHNVQNTQNVTEGIQVQRPVSNNHLETHQHHGPICPYYQQLHANDSTQNRLRKPQKVRVKKRKLPVDGMAYHSRRLGLKVPPKKTLGIKGMVIHNQTREVIHNVYKFMKDEAQNGTKIPISNFRERVLAATGISKCTYSKITSKEFVNGNMVEHALPRRRAPESKKGIKVDEADNVSETVPEGNSLYRPKINRDASTRDGIYNLEELVPARVLLTLESQAIDIVNAGNTTNLGLGEFVATNIQKVLESNIFEEVKIRNISIFLYIHYLLRFINTPMKFVRRKHIACEKSTEVNDHILDNFSILGPNGRTRPVHMKDKSLCYIIVLAALGIDYEVDLANLAKDCKIGIKKALEVSRILAFNTSSKNKHVVTLKLPLPAPVIFTPKRKRY